MYDISSNRHGLWPVTCRIELNGTVFLIYVKTRRHTWPRRLWTTSTLAFLSGLLDIRWLKNYPIKHKGPSAISGLKPYLLGDSDFQGSYCSELTSFREALDTTGQGGEISEPFLHKLCYCYAYLQAICATTALLDWIIWWIPIDTDVIGSIFQHTQGNFKPSRFCITAGDGPASSTLTVAELLHQLEHITDPCLLMPSR